MNSIVTVIVAVLGSGAITSAIVAWSNKDKNKAQVHNMNIEGDLKIGENWREYAKQMSQDLTGVKTELTLIHNKYLDLEKKYNDLYAEHVIVQEESRHDKSRIKELETKVQESEIRVKESEVRIESLQAELSKYKLDNK